MTRQSPPDRYKWHKYYAFEDMEFTQAATALRKEISSKYGSDAQLGTGAVIMHDTNGKESVKATFGLTYPDYTARELDDERICATIMSLAEEYRLEISDVAFFINGFYAHHPPVSNSRVRVGIDTEGVFVRVLPNASKDDFTNSWSEVEIMQGLVWDDYKPTKNKEPHHLQFVYAVFRARRRGLTYRQIYELASKQVLPHYEGRRCRMNGPEIIRRYYEKYKPDS